MSGKQYLVIKGISWRDGGRAEAGEIVSNIPPKSIPWLLADGIIVEATEKTKPAGEVVAGEGGVHTFVIAPESEPEPETPAEPGEGA